jgi:hypothetical protein
MTEAMIEQYLEHHFEPKPNDDFKMEPDWDASFRRRVSGLSVRNSNPPALAGGCLVFPHLFRLTNSRLNFDTTNELL